MIYFFAAYELNLVKVGFSHCPQQRMKTMQAHSPAILHLIGEVDKPAAFERVLHTYWFSHHSHGEWFKLSAIADDIKAIIKGTFDSDKLPNSGVRSWANHRRATNPIAPNGKPYKPRPTTDRVA